MTTTMTAADERGAILDALRELVRRAGSVEAFAKTFRYRLRPSRATLYNWLRGRPIPPTAAKAIQRRARAQLVLPAVLD